MKEVKSKTGFYVGDICYVLADNIYRDIWGKIDYANGVFTVPAGTEVNGKKTTSDFHILVHGTAYGDGCYYDQDDNQYAVDSGTIGVVPIELCDLKSVNSYDKHFINFVKNEEEIERFAYLDYDNGLFTITISDENGSEKGTKTVYINTDLYDDMFDDDNFDDDEFDEDEG